MQRRTFLGAVLAGAAAIAATRWRAAAPTAPAPEPVPVSYAAPVGGSGTITTNTTKWVDLPNSGGLQAHCPDGTRVTRRVSIRWTFTTADGTTGTVTADYPAPVTVAFTIPPGDTGERLTVGPGYGVAVRRNPQTQ